MWIDRLIGERIRARRAALGLTVESVGERTRIDLAVLRAYEAGKKRMVRRDLDKIAQALDLTPDRLLAGEDPKPGKAFPRVSVLKNTVRIHSPQ